MFSEVAALWAQTTCSEGVPGSTWSSVAPTASSALSSPEWMCLAPSWVSGGGLPKPGFHCTMEGREEETLWQEGEGGGCGPTHSSSDKFCLRSWGSKSLAGITEGHGDRGSLGSREPRRAGTAPKRASRLAMPPKIPPPTPPRTACVKLPATKASLDGRQGDPAPWDPNIHSRIANPVVCLEEGPMVLFQPHILPAVNSALGSSPGPGFLLPPLPLPSCPVK